MAAEDEYTPGGGLAAGWQKRLTPEQEQSLEVQKVLFQHSRPYTRMAEDWQDQATQEANLSPEEWRAKVLTQPSDEELNKAMNVALSFGMGTVEPVSGKVAKGLVEGVEKKGAGRLKDPKLKVNIQPRITEPGLEHLSENKYVAKIHTKDDEFVGHMNFTTDPVEKSIHIDWASIPEEGKFGAGQLRHVTREMADRFPDMERVDFVRVSGAGARNKPELEHVSMPLRPENPMFRKLVEQERPSEEFMGPMPGQKRPGVIRTKLGKQGSLDPASLTPEDHEALWAGERGLLDWEMPEQQYAEAVQRYGPEGAAQLEEEARQQMFHNAITDRRNAMSENATDYISPDSRMPTHEDYRGRLVAITDLLEQQGDEGQLDRIMGELGQPTVRNRELPLGLSEAEESAREYQQYERRAIEQDLHPEIERKIFNYADQEGISENQALTVYNHILDRMQREGTERVLGEEMARLHEQRSGR